MAWRSPIYSRRARDDRGSFAHDRRARERSRHAHARGATDSNKLRRHRHGRRRLHRSLRPPDGQAVRRRVVRREHRRGWHARLQLPPDVDMEMEPVAATASRAGSSATATFISCRTWRRCVSRPGSNARRSSCATCTTSRRTRPSASRRDRFCERKSSRAGAGLRRVRRVGARALPLPTSYATVTQWQGFAT